MILTAIVAWLLGLGAGWVRWYRPGGWAWSRQPVPPKGLQPQDEIWPALAHTGFASKRLAMYCHNGRDVLRAIEYAERQLDFAKRHIKIVDPDDPIENEQEFML